MLIPSFARVSNMVAEIPGWLLIPAPIRAILAMSHRRATLASADLGDEPRATCRLLCRSMPGR